MAELGLKRHDENLDDAGSAPPPNPPVGTPTAQPGQPGQPDAATGDGGERLLWSGRASYAALLGHWALLAAAGIVVAALRLTIGNQSRFGTRFFEILVLLLIVLPGLWLLAKTVYLRWGTSYRLTEQRLFIERGLLSRITDQTELIRVDDLRVRQGLVQRLLGLGDVIVVSSDPGNREMVIAGVKGPAAVAEQIRTHMRRLRTKGAVYVQQV